MIFQAVLDFFRDVVINWVGGFDSILAGIDASAAGSAIAGGTAGAGHFIALFVAPSWWGAILSAWGAWMAIWLVTAAIAIIARRGAS